MDRPSPEIVDCPHCGARIPVLNDRCLACAQVLAVYIGPRPKVRGFGLGTLMGWIAVLAVFLGAIRWDLCFGIAMSTLLLPTLFRVYLAVAERKMDGRPMRFQEIYVEFWISIGITILIELSILTSAMAWVVMMGYFGIPIGPKENPVGFGLGLVFSCFIGWKAARKIWPRRD